jgi:hypothetical protein
MNSKSSVDSGWIEDMAGERNWGREGEVVGVEEGKGGTQQE